jgi:acyl carrier protein
MSIAFEQFPHQATRENLAPETTREKRERMRSALDARKARRNVFPLSCAQRTMWALHEWAPESAAYNEAPAFVLHGPVDPERVVSALKQIAQRHEVLRTTYDVDSNGEPVQRVGADVEPFLEIRVLDLDRSSVRTILAEEVRRPFSLRHGPTVRCLVLRPEEDLTIVVVTAHHISVDGWGAVRLLPTELQAFYEGIEMALPSLQIQYKDYALWESERARLGAFDGSLAYWRSKLDGAEPGIALPTDRPRPALQTFEGDRCFAAVPPAVFGRFERLCRDLDVSLSAGMIAALQLLLGRWTGQRDLVVGTVTAHRERSEVEPLLGNFINFLPIRTHLSDAQSAVDVIEDVGAVVVEALAREECPFSLVVERARSQRRLPGQNPIYNVAFLLHRFPSASASSVASVGFETAGAAGTRELFDDLGIRFGRPFSLGEASGGMGWIDNGSALLDLRFVAFPYPDGTCLVECEYNTALFDRGTADLVTGAYGALLEELVATPRVKWLDLTSLASLAGHAAASARSAAQHPGAAADPDDDGEPSPMEGALCAIFAEALGAASVRPSDNFFALGGDSLGALQVLYRIEEKLGVRVSVSVLNEAPTAAQLGRSLTARLAAELEIESEVIERP